MPRSGLQSAWHASLCNLRINFAGCWFIGQSYVGMRREFEFSLLSGPNLADMAVTERLQVSAGIATVQLAYGGKLIVETTDLTAQGLKVGTCCLLQICCIDKGAALAEQLAGNSLM